MIGVTIVPHEECCTQHLHTTAVTYCTRNTKIHIQVPHVPVVDDLPHPAEFQHSLGLCFPSCFDALQELL